MDAPRVNVAPAATDAAAVPPTAAAREQRPGPPLGTAPPAAGIAQPQAAPPAKRSRLPRGPNPPSSSAASSGAPALLEIAAAAPMFTVQRRAANFFLPDANMLFHVLSLCDGMMGSTHRFLQSSPAWLPIVSQFYISILWVYHIMRVYANTGYGLHFASLLRDLDDVLRLDECMIPGPLVPFFEALAAINGPFDWIGDITSAMPDFDTLFNPTNWHVNYSQLRSVPFPALLLDQLYYFATWTIPANQTLYGNFEWYRNIFSHPRAGNLAITGVLGPQSTGSLFVPQAQVDAARSFWNAAMQGFTRLNNGAGQAPLHEWLQLFGFINQGGHHQLDQFQHVSLVMQKYCHFFNGSRAIKTVSLTGVGSVAVHSRPIAHTTLRDWLYPANLPGPFLSSRFFPIHEFPNGGFFDFQHADHELEEIAEQYATLTLTNVQWARNNAAQHRRPPIALADTHDGEYWNMLPHRQINRLNFKVQFAQIIASRYHQSTAIRTE